ncbi:MAG: hypothetical protein ABSB61_06550 [Anaerolineales bacterium]
MSTIRSLFLEVRRDYFPRWQTWRSWHVRLATRAAYLSGSDGYCDVTLKLICVGPDNIGPKRVAVLIHECVHAVGSPSHGKAFRKRLAIAQHRAEELGQAEVAKILEEDVRRYELPTEPCSASSLYVEIADALLDTKGRVGFADLEKGLARWWGMPLAELRRRAPRLRHAYDAARRDHREEEECRAAFRRLPRQSNPSRRNQGSRSGEGSCRSGGRQWRRDLQGVAKTRRAGPSPALGEPSDAKIRYKSGQVAGPK